MVRIARSEKASSMAMARIKRTSDMRLHSLHDDFSTTEGLDDPWVTRRTASGSSGRRRDLDPVRVGTRRVEPADLEAPEPAHARPARACPPAFHARVPDLL